MAFNDVNDFYSHQASPYHTGFTTEFGECFESIKLEWIDPLGAAHGRFPPTVDTPLPDEASEAIAAERRRMPLREAPWWRAMRIGADG